MIVEDCPQCLGQPGGCGLCGGSGIKPLTSVDKALIRRDVESVQKGKKIKSWLRLDVIDGGKLNK